MKKGKCGKQSEWGESTLQKLIAKGMRAGKFRKGRETEQKAASALN